MAGCIAVALGVQKRRRGAVVAQNGPHSNAKETKERLVAYIEADQGHETATRTHKVSGRVPFMVNRKEKHSQPDVDLSDILAIPVGPILGLAGGKVGFCSIEGLEEDLDVALVGILSGGKARLVDAVVDLVIDPLVRLLDVLAERLWV